MQSNIYAKVAPLLKEIPPNCELKRLEIFFSFYHSGNIIYPGAMHRELGLHIKEVYQILEAGVVAGALEPILEIYCPKCQRFSGLRYERVFDIPDEVNCIHCDEKIERASEHAIVVYKVL
jgi:hypothetical protein